MQQISELNVDTTINELLNSELGFLLTRKTFPTKKSHA